MENDHIISSQDVAATPHCRDTAGDIQRTLYYQCAINIFIMVSLLPLQHYLINMENYNHAVWRITTWLGQTYIPFHHSVCFDGSSESTLTKNYWNQVINCVNFVAGDVGVCRQPARHIRERANDARQARLGITLSIRHPRNAHVHPWLRPRSGRWCAASRVQRQPEQLQQMVYFWSVGHH